MSYMNPLAALKPSVSGVMSTITSVTSAVTRKVSSAASAIFSAVSNTANSVYPAFANSAKCFASLCARSPIIAVATGAATMTGIAYVAYRTLQSKTSFVEEAVAEVISEESLEEVALETPSISEEVAEEISSTLEKTAEETSPVSEKVTKETSSISEKITEKFVRNPLWTFIQR
jgi:prophage DNA circulation protein